VLPAIDGRVTNRYVHPGTLVGPAAGAGAMTPIVRIETSDRLRLVVPVPENDAAGVPEGIQVNFTAPPFPGRAFRAPIARISHDIDTKTRTMPVELDVRDPREELVPGTFCEVERYLGICAQVTRWRPTVRISFAPVLKYLLGLPVQISDLGVVHEYLTPERKEA
jgi:multidrug efflux pump subunit AcrA (membrane-fusion protein)